MSYLPFFVVNAAILAMVAHVFMASLSDRRNHLARVRSRRELPRRTR